MVLKKMKKHDRNISLTVMKENISKKEKKNTDIHQTIKIQP